MVLRSEKKEKREKEELVEKLLLENYNKYYRLAWSYVYNGDDAADIVQNGAYKALLYCAGLKEKEFAGTWLYRIMMNEIFRFLKKPRAFSLDAVREEDSGEPGREDVYQDFDLQRALDSLDQKDKLVVELRYFEDRKLEEISEILEENLSTVKSRLYRSLKKLRVKLGENEEIIA